MFIGHFGVGFASKKIINRPSLGTLFLAAQFIDLIWPLLLLLNLEKVVIDPGNTAFTPLDFVSYPISHSMAAVILWGVLFGGVYYLFKKDVKSSVVLGLLVFSHWVLDFLTHRPDLLIIPGWEFYVGLGLWDSVAATIIIESIIFFGGVFLYWKITKPINRKGTIILWLFVGFLFVIYLGNIFGPPPPSTEPIAFIGFAQWLLVVWGYWIDRNRKLL